MQSHSSEELDGEAAAQPSFSRIMDSERRFDAET